MNKVNYDKVTKEQYDKMTKKEQLMYEFSSTLIDFWGEKPTKRKIVEAWHDYLDAVREDKEEQKEVPESFYKLTMDEKKILYKEAGLL